MLAAESGTSSAHWDLALAHCELRFLYLLLAVIWSLLLRSGSAHCVCSLSVEVQ